MNSYELYHEGVKRRSGRYPWGSGARPYQSMEPAKKQKLSITSYVRGRQAKKQQEKNEKLKEEARTRAAQLAEEKRQRDADKERVLREGSGEEVLRYRGELTNQELQNAVTRLNLEASLTKISEKEKQATMSTIDNIMQNVKMVTNWAKIGTDTYNTIADIYNITEEGRKNPLQKIGSGGSGGDGKKK